MAEIGDDKDDMPDWPLTFLSLNNHLEPFMTSRILIFT